MGETATASGRVNSPRGGDGKFRRTIDSVDRDVRAAELHAQGRTYAQIAAELGYHDTGAAHRGVERALTERVQGETLRVARETRLQELDDLRAALWRLITNPPPLTDRLGRIVMDPDTQAPVLDAQAVVSAASTIVRASERTARLQGLDAPRRTQTSIEATIASIPPEDLRLYIQQRRAELEGTTAQRWQQQSIGERRRALEQALADLDTEAEQAAIPGAAETA